jgi:hypothetical protein
MIINNRQNAKMAQQVIMIVERLDVALARR